MGHSLHPQRCVITTAGTARPVVRLSHANDTYDIIAGTIGRVPFDQKFRFEFPKFSYVEWNSIFHRTGQISFYSRLSTFPT